MLVQFRIRNFMSIRDEQVFSMVAATGLKEKGITLTENVFHASDGIDLVKSAVVYGANASGKSNLLRATKFLADSIIRMAPTNTKVISYSPYVFDPQIAAEPTLLEAVIFVEGVYYRYGFEILNNELITEWLFIKVKKETYVFERNRSEMRINRPYRKLVELKNNSMITTNVLFVNLGFIFNENACRIIYLWALSTNFTFEDDDLYDYHTTKYLEEEINKKRVIELLKYADLGIDDIDIEVKLTKLAKNSTKHQIETEIRTIRSMYDSKTGQFERFSMPLDSFESEGTKKFFTLIGFVLEILDKGHLLIADELDTKLHPLLTQRIIQLFNSPVTNPKNAQFIFATHDTNLLSANLFRRDQIWFTEKDQKGATQLYALTDYKPGKTVRNDEQLEKNYIAGKYGGIPYLGNFDALFEQSVPKPVAADE